MKKIVLLFGLLCIVWFSFADINISNTWKNFYCAEKEWSCCMSDVCSISSVSCIQWTSPMMKWCDEKCMPIMECKKDNIEEIKNNSWSKLEKIDKNLFKKFNIKTENESEEQVKINVKNVKIEKINNVSSKLDIIVQKVEGLSYDSSKLKKYVEKLKNIQYSLNQGNIKNEETKKYNRELNNAMNNIKKELSNIKNAYKSQ